MFRKAIRSESLLPIIWQVDAWLRTCRTKYCHGSIGGRFILLLVAMPTLHPIPYILPLARCPQKLCIEILCKVISMSYLKPLLTYRDIVREHPICYTSKLRKVLLCCCLALQVVCQEVIQH
jgi:hypothetical protein